MANLQNTESPISRVERNKINGNWEAILENFRHLQRQINILAGTDVEALIKTITDTIDQANQTVMDLIDETTEVTDQKVAEVNAALDNLSTLLTSALQQMETARIEANNAATNANDKANLAQTAADDANTATANANTATQNTNEAISNAETATNQANTAREEANSAASLANDAAASANTAKDNAITATNEAIEATENVISATSQANEVIGATITATEEANAARDDALQAAQSVISAIATMQADIQATKDAFAHKGEYSASVQYYKDNEVSFNGSTYRARKDTQGNAPTPLVDNEYWLVVARRGVDGSGAVHSINNQVGDVVLEPSTIGAASEMDLKNLSETMGEVDARLTIQLDQIAVNVKTFDAVGDGFVDDTTAISNAIDSVLINGGGSLFFPKGIYIVSTEIIKSLASVKLSITGNHAVIKLVQNPFVKNFQTVLRFNDVNKDFKIQGLTIDANNQASNPLMLHNYSADMNNVANVLIEDSTFLNGTQTNDTLYQSGVYIRGAFDTITINRAGFKNMYSSKTTLPVSRGLHVAPDTGISNWTRQLIVDSSSFEDIYNDTGVDSDGLSYFNGISDTTFSEGVLTVTSSKFKNCKTRSIKSQVQTNVVTDCVFYRNKYEGSNEVDFQYAGAIAQNNTFIYDGFGTTYALSASIRDNIHNQINFSNNSLTVKNGASVYAFLGSSATGAFPTNNIIVDNNKVNGEVTILGYFRVAAATENFLVLNSNTAKTTEAFIKFWRYGSGTPHVVVSMDSNNELGNEKQILNVTTTHSFKKFTANNRIATTQGNISSSSDIIPAVVRQGLYSRKVLQGSVIGTNSMDVNIDWKSVRGAMKLTCLMSTTNQSSATAYLSSYECICVITSSGAVKFSEVRNDNAEIGVFNVEANGTLDGYVIKKSVGTSVATLFYVIIAEGIERG